MNVIAKVSDTMSNPAREVLAQWETGWITLSLKFASPYRIESFVLRHADVEGPGSPLPNGVNRGTPKECFRNAATMTMGKPRFDYCEGYAVHKDIAFPFLHAWCIDRETGLIIEPTLEHPQDYHYIGITIPKKLLMTELYRNGVYGLLDTGCGYNVKFMKRFERANKRLTPLDPK